ncbi:hypothetical protein [Barnesiella sp.]|nr:hypothetical protein [Barnesiella sp.]
MENLFSAWLRRTASYLRSDKDRNNSLFGKYNLSVISMATCRSFRVGV